MRYSENRPSIFSHSLVTSPCNFHTNRKDHAGKLTRLNFLKNAFPSKSFQVSQICKSTNIKVLQTCASQLIGEQSFHRTILSFWFQSAKDILYISVTVAWDRPKMMSCSKGEGGNSLNFTVCKKRGFNKMCDITMLVKIKNFKSAA